MSRALRALMQDLTLCLEAGTNPCLRETAAGLLTSRLRPCLLIVRRIGHAHAGAIDHDNASACHRSWRPRCCNCSDVCFRMRRSASPFSLLRAWQYAEVDADGNGMDRAVAKACTLRTTSWHPPSASRTWVKNAQNVFSLLNIRRRLKSPSASLRNSRRRWRNIMSSPVIVRDFELGKEV